MEEKEERTVENKNNNSVKPTENIVWKKRNKSINKANWDVKIEVRKKDYKVILAKAKFALEKVNW